MRPWSLIGRRAGSALLALSLPTTAMAQAPPAPAPAARVSMADAVRLALAHNHHLRAQRLDVDISKADEITAGLKPNPVLTSTNENFPLFAPSQLFSGDNFLNNQNFVESLGYLFERGGKRRNRTLVARDSTDVTARNAIDAERQLRFDTEQAFINVLLAKSSLDLARENLDNFSNVLEVNRERLRAGDLAEGEFFKVSLQKLQFEQDASTAEMALIQAKAALRQNVGFDSIADQFDVEGELAYAKFPVTRDALVAEALATRPDLLAAQSNVKLAQDSQALAFSNRARDVSAGVEYDRAGTLSAVGFSVSVDLPFHDRNQGNIAHSKVAVAQASELESHAINTVRTDVDTAFAALQTSERILALYQSGYLDQAKQSLDITTYVYQHGNGTLLDLLDAERTYRATQLGYRQALATYMTSVQQINFAVGKQVMP